MASNLNTFNKHKQITRYIASSNPGLVYLYVDLIKCTANIVIDYQRGYIFIDNRQYF